MGETTRVTEAVETQPLQLEAELAFEPGPSHFERSAEPPPLVVDVDGTLTPSDLFWEGLLNVALKHPARILPVLRTGLGDKARMKESVARYGTPELDTIPLDSRVLQLIEQTRKAGRPVLLVSGACDFQVKALASRVQATEGLGSRPGLNLTGARKLGAISRISSQFDYVGNALADLPLWMAAQSAYAVRTAPLTRWIAMRRRPDLIFLGARPTRFGAWLRALRPHQWTKNVLLLLPALAAHLAWTAQWAALAVIGILIWSIAASGIYLLNDLLDIESDRRHSTKRRRPFAAGDISVPAGLLAAALLTAVAASAAAWVSGAFLQVLSVYVLISVAYSLGLKRWPLLDVIVLAILYTIRVIGGAVLLSVPLSRWFLGFAVFLFFSLGLLKRVIELQGVGPGSEGASLVARGLPGRGYRLEDRTVLVAFGIGSAIAADMVYCLYITSADVTRLYGRPDLLWLGLPILLYVQARMWLLAGRNEMHEDPVVFGLTDRPSLIAAALFMALVALGSA